MKRWTQSTLILMFARVFTTMPKTSVNQWFTIVNIIQYSLMLPSENMFIAWQSNPTQAPNCIELLVCLKSDDSTSQPQRILNPSLSCLSRWGTVSQGEAREESMLEKAGLTERSLICHLVPRDQASYAQISTQNGLMEIYSLHVNFVYLDSITVWIVNMLTYSFVCKYVSLFHSVLAFHFQSYFKSIIGV